ncbi:facilitated trehalose transporter Tret1-2 homolog isoform X1 [Danaus plexippus]|uniref:facilitated trehalose transporter Tret1-2 homolog isoform X1 n=2 Tax=Danaus plexippus TaxID=13037 RepID=UPI002AAFDEBE|nr:facilitated trehalose transporter Tret1-2 homolog isoform X1 [Danaus plexippus]
MSIINQLLATAIMCYTSAVLGLLSALPSSTMKLFISENTPLNRVMTETEVSLMGSISCVSTLIMTPFCGCLLDVFGRKRSMILFFLPQLLAWMLLVSLNSVEAFICAMFLCGLSGSIFLIVPVYINEFCDSSIRGALSSSVAISFGVGVLVSYGLGGILEYSIYNYTGLCLAVISLILLYFLRESPFYLMGKGFEKEATSSIAFYKGLEPECKEVIAEIQYLSQLLENNITKNDDIEEMERLTSEIKQPIQKLSTLKFLRESASTRRALVVLIILYTTCIFQGLLIVQIFAKSLFAIAIPSMSSNLSSVIFGLILVLSGCFGTYLVEAVGRRTLLIVSSIATGVLCVILGTQLQFQWGSGWLTAVLIYVYTITYSFGAGSVPYILIGEIFLPQIRSFASTLALEWAYFCNFVLLFIFTPLFNAFGLGPIFHFFGGFSFFTALFAFIYLPETKNLPVDVIQRKFLERN